MRSAGNFNSEWGYLAPAPSFLRTLRVVLVATAIGATAGAAVVVSLMDRPVGGGDKITSISPHAIVTSAQAAPAIAAPAIAAPAVAAAPVAAPVNAAPTQPAMARPSNSAAAASATPPGAVQTAAPSPATGSSAQASLNTAAPENSAPSAQPATGMTAMSEAPSSGEAVHAADAPDQASTEPTPDDKKAKHHLASATAVKKPTPNLGSMLRRIFNPPTGRSYYPNR